MLSKLTYSKKKIHAKMWLYSLYILCSSNHIYRTNLGITNRTPSFLETKKFLVPMVCGYVGISILVCFLFAPCHVTLAESIDVSGNLESIKRINKHCF
jgi:hypothetical protein